MTNMTAADRQLTEKEITELREMSKASIGTFLIDFKQHMDRQFEVVKLLGGGNATGVLATGALLAGTFNHPELRFLLKCCAATFMAGVFAFIYAYWCLYLWFHVLERISEKTERAKTVADVGALRDEFPTARYMEKYWKTGASISFYCFVAGCILVGAGIFRLS